MVKVVRVFADGSVDDPLCVLRKGNKDQVVWVSEMQCTVEFPVGQNPFGPGGPANFPIPVGGGVSPPGRPAAAAAVRKYKYMVRDAAGNPLTDPEVDIQN